MQETKDIGLRGIPVAGWCAHIIEERFAEAQPKPALYRPEADYIGNYCGIEECKYVSIEERK